MSLRSVSVAAVGLVWLGFAGCSTTDRDFSHGAGGKSGAGQGGGGASGTAQAGGGLGGSAGLDAQAGEGGRAGEAGSTDEAGSAGMAGESNVPMDLEIVQPSLDAGKTYVLFSGKISASGAARYTWSIAKGSLPEGLALQGAQSATVTIAGTPTEAGQFPVTLSVTDGSTTKTVDVTVVITHSALFLSDRNVAGVNELFLAEIGGATAAAPVRLSASFPTGGGVSSYAWSPDGSKVLYLATQSSGGAAELWMASLASPGTAQRVSAPGVAVSQLSWLGSGNVAAYATSTADSYLVDLSGATPGASKLVATSSGVTNTADAGISTFLPSPNGTSILFPYYLSGVGAVTYAYVTWATGSPKTTTWNEGLTAFHGYSYDGRYIAQHTQGVGSWRDLSLASPTNNDLGYNSSGTGTWSPNSDSLLYNGDYVSPDDPTKLKLGTFAGGTLTSIRLVQSSGCGTYFAKPWSPNGKNVVFTCGRDVRGFSDVVTASVGTDFSLLPSGFVSNAFTDAKDVGWSPDSMWIGILADHDVDKQYDLSLVRWSAPGVAYKAHANTSAQGVASFAFSPNSRSVALLGTISPQANTALYLTKLSTSGAPPIATLVSAPASAVVQTDISWLPGSRVLTYRATVSGAVQLFAIPIATDGTAGPPVSISGVSGRGVGSYQLAPAR